MPETKKQPSKGWGGARKGAGRKPQEPATTGITDAKAFLEGVVAGQIEASAAQIRAAQALLPFQHPKKGEAGKKDDAANRQKAASAGKFGVRQGPRLVASK